MAARRLVEAGFAVVLLETRYVKAASRALTVKTDRNNARGMAQLLRLEDAGQGPGRKAAGMPA